MTSENVDNGSPGGSRPGRPPRPHADQGDLWGGGEAAADSGAPAAPRRPRARAAPPPASQPPRPRNPAPAVAAPAVQPYEEADDDDEYYDDEPSMLSNPYVLAAVAVAGAIVLAVLVVFLFGRGDGGTASPGATGDATPSPTTAGDGPDAIGLMARSIAISTVREGPALNHLELGTLPANQDVDVVGRNEDATWFLIVFPPQTELRGWVPETALRLPDDVADIVDVAESTPVARPEVPATATTPPEPDITATPDPDAPGPDLAAGFAGGCEAGEDIVVEISNTGTEDLDKALIEVIISNNSIVQYQQPFQADIVVGASATLPTDVPARAPNMSVIVNLTELGDVDPSNNSATCEVEADGSNSNGSNNNNNGNGNGNGGGGNLPPPVPTPGN